MNTVSPLLHADAISIARGDSLLIEALSLSLHAGEALHVRGDNGAGKSTLLLALAGLIPIADGTLEVEAEALAFLGHDNGLMPDLTVAENLAVYAGSGISPDPATAQALGLDDLTDKPAKTLSFGQSRRVALALTCLPEKAIWLLDEPFAGLDQQSAANLTGILVSALDAGTALVFSSHERSIEGATTLDLDQRV